MLSRAGARIIPAVLALTVAAVRAPAQNSGASNTPSALSQHEPSLAPEQTQEPPLSWREFFPRVLHDQRRIWLFPATLARGEHWLPTSAFILGTGGMIALDPYDSPYFRRTTRFHEFNQTVSGFNAAAAMAIVPATFYAVGHFRHDSYMENTVQLAGEAVLDSEVLNLVIRDSTNRLPPSEIPANGNFADSFFERHKGPFYTGSGGFPSGHMIAAMSIATIFANRYRHHRWVPWLAYGLAGAVGFSRITLSDHFPSDVFAGAFLGYAVSRYDVLGAR
jgi:membrane-associated phospholipid phosphatase